LPEYDSAVPRTAQEQCAAYAIATTRNQAVFVRCVFELSPAATSSVEVKATGGGVLGALDALTLSFAGPGTISVDMPLAHRSFNAAGRHDVTWQWWWRAGPREAWQPLVTTAHRIYLTLDLPGAPWTQTYADKRNPWTDLLDHACPLVAGRREEMGVSISLAKAIYTNYSLRYDIRSGAPRYGFGGTSGSFNMSNWITYVLQGLPPASPTFCQGSGEAYNDNWIINCYDAAASLALMGKLVGARLDYYFHGPFGYLRFVRPIGRGKCNNPFYGCWSNDPVRGADDTTRTGFGNHAYTKLAGQNNYDACMRQWRGWLEQLILSILYLIVWLILLIFSLGSVNRFDLLERAAGWLVNMTQPDYNAATIDTSTAAEAAAAGGTPVVCALNFQVT
ncbi:MAG TPA: hypothetical protein VHQ87_02435, partial [Rhizobacter sp.]|nr:hypothetical protein [Rhizobacter sp.]